MNYLEHLRKIINISSSFYRSNISNNIEYINNRYVNEADNIDLNQEGVDSQIEINMKNFNIRMFSSILSSKKLNKNSYFIKITNLLDEKYQRPHGYGQEGRIIKFGLNF